MDKRNNIVILGNGNITSNHKELVVFGGAELQIWQLAKELSRRDNDIFFLFPDNTEKSFIQHGCRILSVPGKWSSPKGIYHLYTELRKIAPSIIITRAANPLLVIYALISKIVGAKLIYFSAHDWELRNRGRLGGWRWLLFYIGLQVTFCVLCQNNVQLKGFKKLIISKNHKILIMDNLLLLKIIDEPEDPGDYFTWIGTYSPKSIHKNPDWIIKIAKIIPNKKFHLVIHFWNNKNLENEFKCKIKKYKNIKLSISLDRKSMYDVHKETCALLITSDGEGFPNVALEAWSQGRCVISRDTNSLNGLTADEGVYIAKGIDDFTMIIKSTTVNEFKKTGINGLNYLKNKYQSSNQLERLEQLFYET